MNQEQLLARAMNQQYLIVQDQGLSAGWDKNQHYYGKNRPRMTDTVSTDWARTASQQVNQNKLPSERLINGDDSYFSRMQNETLSTKDTSLFMRHGDIDTIDFKVRIDFLRDFKNKLGLLSTEDEVLYSECLERDSTR